MGIGPYLYFSVKHEVEMSVAGARRVILLIKIYNVNSLTTILTDYRMALKKVARYPQYSRIMNCH